MKRAKLVPDLDKVFRQRNVQPVRYRVYLIAWKDVSEFDRNRRRHRNSGIDVLQGDLVKWFERKENVPRQHKFRSLCDAGRNRRRKIISRDVRMQNVDIVARDKVPDAFCTEHPE